MIKLAAFFAVPLADLFAGTYQSTKARSFIEVHMLDIFLTDDGEYHQAVLSDDSEDIVTLTVDKPMPGSNEPGGWDLMVWDTDRWWRGPSTTRYGSEASLEAVKLAASDAKVVLPDQVSSKNHLASEETEPMRHL
jgi:hypothetical protein